jgi:tetratricopeptide (TPR) repeat protein
MRLRWLWLGLVLVVGVAVMAVLAWRAIEQRRWRQDLEQAKREVAAGEYARARRRLVELVARHPDEGEPHFLFGVCERARGQIEAAVAAWARVPEQSPFAAAAAFERGRAEIDRGRFAAAERVLQTALRDPRAESLPIRGLLAPLLWYQGRQDEAIELVEAEWPHARPAEAPGLLRLHIALSSGSAIAEGTRKILERAAKLAPDDDRVWLGRAQLATRTGRFDEAARWLDECLRRRPDDRAVWTARLDWALATEQADRVRQAMEHLPAAALPPGRAFALAAWFAARRGDIDAARRALQRTLEANPGDLTALERLAELEVRSGHPDRAAELRRRRAELDRVTQRYQDLFKADQLERDAEEMARLAETLGRRFEAEAFLTLALQRRPDDRTLRAELAQYQRAAIQVSDPNATLAQFLETELALSGASDAKRNPEAAEGPTARLHFEDDAQRVGLAFVFHNGETPIHQIPEVSAGGVGLIDYNGDGWLDVYCVQGGPFPPSPNPQLPSPPSDRLFRNRGDGTFEDATRSAGLEGRARGYGHGVAVGDYDNDGRPDLFVTRWRSYALYRNRGDGTFEDVTEPAGLGGARDWPTSAAFADLDGDGDLDLYVCHYLDWDAEHPRLCRGSAQTAYITCDPRSSAALPDHLFRNDNGRFVDVSAEAGITAADTDGRGFGVVTCDLDDDGKLDIYVANDMSANFLFHNLGNFRFAEVGHASGVAANAEGGYQAGMGVACGDLDGDGLPDLAVTNFFGESTTFYQNLGAGLFTDRTAALGLKASSRSRLGFGIALFDTDDDGRLDLMTANGHVNDYRPNVPYAMPAQLLLNGPEGRLIDVTERAGPPFTVPHIGRGLAVGDLDNDGRLDAVMVAHNEPLVTFHNQTAGGRSLTLRLEGTASNRDAVGARVTVAVGGRRLVAWRTGGGSFLSASDPRLHFGVGDAARIDQIEIRWPSGRVDHYRDLAPSAGYLIREGDAAPCPLEGWRPIGPPPAEATGRR